MKKKTFLSAVILCVCILSARAQSVAFFQGDTKLDNGATLTITEMNAEYWGDEDEPWYYVIMESGLSLRNTSASAVSVSLEQTEVDFPSTIVGDEEGGFLFCAFGECIPSWKPELLKGDIPANTTSEGFHIALNPVVTVDGTYKAKYVLKHQLTSQEIASVNVVFEYDSSKLGISDDNVNKYTKIYKIGSDVFFDYEFESNAKRSIAIYNIVGNLVSQQALSETKGSVNLSGNLSQGIYVVAVKEDGRIIRSEKIVVQ